MYDIYEGTNPFTDLNITITFAVYVFLQVSSNHISCIDYQVKQIELSQ